MGKNEKVKFWPVGFAKEKNFLAECCQHKSSGGYHAANKSGHLQSLVQWLLEKACDNKIERTFYARDKKVKPFRDWAHSRTNSFLLEKCLKRGNLPWVA